MKILVTGNAGSGKSTLAKQLAAELGLPVYSLDAIVWQPGWKKTPATEREQRIMELASRPQWIIDGVSLAVQEAADLVIFLDTPRRVCFWRAAKRNHKYLFSSRPELPANCPEALIIPTLIKIIWRFPAKVRPKILALHRQKPETLLRISTQSQSDLSWLHKELKSRLTQV